MQKVNLDSFILFPKNVILINSLNSN
ncbi:hypothetical protein VAEU17_4290224 [Vibrio aestuarianus]|nr:hypothetical protein VAEU17_4290224 [Vibrio aestuarianus]